MPSRIDLTGQRFGYLTVIKYSHTKTKRAYWVCKCACGEKKIIPGQSLRAGRTKSCGCLTRGKRRGAGNPMYGRHQSKKAKKRMSQSKLGNKNPMWKGDDVGYISLHEWVGNRLEKPKVCGICKKNKPYDLANKGVYDRDLKNWEWLCRKCHMIKDGRLKKFIQVVKNRAKNKLANKK